MNAVFAFLGALLVSGRNVEQAAVTNIAYGSRVLYCGNETGFGYLVNGIINEQPGDVMVAQCYQPAYIEIHFNEMYYVNYIIVYEGNVTDGNMNQLDYFNVILNVQNQWFRCSSYPKTAAMGRDENGKFMINCFSKLAHKITLSSRTSSTLYINEIEAYSYAETFGNNMMVYRGCFSLFRYVIQDKDPLFCHSTCSIRFPYLALSKKLGCYCGFDVGGDERPRTQCNQTCGPSNVECGGTGVYSIFIVHLQLPYYYGCFDIVSDRKAVTLENEMTIVKCLKHCEDDYYALLTSGVTCSCQEEEFLNGVTRTFASCDVLCPDGENFCGGKTYSAAYKTCTPTCSPLFQCSEWNEFGMCQVSCDNSHAGPHCLRKVDFVNFTLADETTTKKLVVIKFIPCGMDGLCPDDTNTVCDITKYGDFACVCRPGFETIDMRYCFDTDECVGYPCDNVSSCINTVGSYYCRCRPGAVRIKGVCEYVDKCNDMVFCDPLTTLCVNEGTSYRCLCKDGFKKVDRFKCEDIDECKFDEPICGDVARCLNREGSYTCQCSEGLDTIKTLFRVICQDIDECDIPNQFPCNESNEVCINIFSSYVCECTAGFTKVAKKCKVIGETSTREDIYVLPVKTVDNTELQPQPSESTLYAVFGSLLFFCFAFLAFIAIRLRGLAESPLPEFDENDIDLIRTHLPELLEVYRDERRSSRSMSRSRD